MKRIMLTVAYDGTNYHGWQVQKSGLTIEEVLHTVLQELLDENVEVIGASRTDAGVHALGNIAVFDTETKIPTGNICMALNQRLPEDIRVYSSVEVPFDFHPRHAESEKTYEYLIENKRIYSPINRLYSYFLFFPLNLKKMKRAAAFFKGEHDFQSFCSAGGQALTTVRVIKKITVEEQDDGLIKITVVGNGFLYNMVRIIVGTLLDVGKERIAPEDIPGIIESKDRSKAGPTAAPEGLTLIGIKYLDKGV
ncbi:MAG TPA: tRNA pseudouridine(38-40) synthase TruA [Ruminococcaceae bacterium]|nr:tRNA pseudouridine(38-40) synthase TruA [Oscillospiraceae bacterium]